MTTKTAALTLTAALLTLGVAAPAAASGGGNDVRTHGACSAGTTWKLKAKGDNGRIEVEGEIDSNRVGQTWHWKLKDNGAVVATGTGVTAGRSGSFSVVRKPADRTGTDHFVFRATYAATGEVCRGTVVW